MKIPLQYLPVMPYLIIPNAKAFIEFMQTVFKASIQLEIPRDEQHIMHGELKIHDAVIMFADATEEFTARPAGMFIYVSDVDTIYNSALENGATSLRTPNTEEYGYNAGFEDSFGNQWWVVEPGEE